jgi:hypothetical protein
MAPYDVDYSSNIRQALLCGAPAREEGIRAGAECAVLQGTFQVGV